MEETKTTTTTTEKKKKKNDADTTTTTTEASHLHRQTFLPPPPPASSPPKHRNDRIVLCIGGQILQTSTQTLCVDSRSMLAAWVLRHINVTDEEDGYDDDNEEEEEEEKAAAAAEEGTINRRKEIVETEVNNSKARNAGKNRSHPHGKSRVLWIDRDARRFRHVLNYLRNGTIWLDDVASLRAVQEEASFFGIDGLEALCEERIQEQEASRRKKGEELQKVIQDAIADFCRESGIFLGNNHHHNLHRSSNGNMKGEVLAILRGRRLGSSDSVTDEPVFRMDEDF